MSYFAVLFSSLILGIMSMAGIAPGELVSAHIRSDTPAPREHVEIMFGGDVMFDRTIRTAARIHGGDYLFSCLDPLFSTADLVVANLEGPITEFPSTSEGSTPGDDLNYTFTFPTSTAALLYRHNVRMVSLGNNHIMNFKLEGLLQTKTFLDAAGVGHFGDADLGEDAKVARIEIRGIRFSFVNWSDWTSDKTDHTMAQIHKEVLSGRVVVAYNHWGEEYQPPTDYMRRLGHALVDAGASIVIGSHPHVVQESELYKGKYIYYSLGNLIFDQYFDESVSHGLILSAVFSKDGIVSVKEVPVELKRDRQTCPITT